MVDVNAAAAPSYVQVVLDTTDARGLAEVYRRLPRFHYRPGDESPPANQPDERGHDWLVIRHAWGAPRIAFQQVNALSRSSTLTPTVTRFASS